jgi:hypothetical protein
VFIVLPPPSFLIVLRLPPDMADRCARSGGKPSVRVVTSGPQGPKKATATSTQRNVTLRTDPIGRLQQSVSYTTSEEPTADGYPELPSLLEVEDDDDDDDDENTNNLADAMEKEFFGSKDRAVPEAKKLPVCLVLYMFYSFGKFLHILGASRSRLVAIPPGIC